MLSLPLHGIKHFWLVIFSSNSSPSNVISSVSSSSSDVGLPSCWVLQVDISEPDATFNPKASNNELMTFSPYIFLILLISTPCDTPNSKFESLTIIVLNKKRSSILAISRKTTIESLMVFYQRC